MYCAHSGGRSSKRAGIDRTHSCTCKDFACRTSIPIDVAAFKKCPTKKFEVLLSMLLISRPDVLYHAEFAEIMRAMECPYRVDLESFQYPDFPLVAKVLRWLVLR